jgi:plasmid stabilization system protein ParE
VRSRYILAPDAALDLVQIWRYVKNKSSVRTADRVESTIRDKIAFLVRTPAAGHWRKDLTDESVKFFPVYSYLIVYRPETKPLQVAAILHGYRDIEELLKNRL